MHYDRAIADELMIGEGEVEAAQSGCLVSPRGFERIDQGDGADTAANRGRLQVASSCWDVPIYLSVWLVQFVCPETIT